MRGSILLHVLLTCIIVVASVDDSVEQDILLDFKNSLSNATALDNWNKDVPLCHWIGVFCSAGDVFGLILEYMGLSGVLNVESLTKLSNLQHISFRNNTFVGPFPSNINKVSDLYQIDLSNNKFSGEIPGDAFKGLNLASVLLGNNDFTGNIPKSLVNMSALNDLQLQYNNFEGGIPDFEQKDLLIANFAYNKLEGPIPTSLSNKNPSFFAGNNLCGKPLGKCPPSKKKSSPKVAFHL